MKLLNTILHLFYFHDITKSVIGNEAGSNLFKVQTFI